MFGLTALQCFVVVVCIYALIYWLTPQKHIWLPFIFITVAMAVIAFNIVPDSSDDLAIYFKVIREMYAGGKDSLDYYIKTDQFEWKTYRCCAYYYYIVAQLGKGNPHYLTAATIFMAYGSTFLIFYKAYVKFAINKSYMFFATLFFISTYWFYDIASGIRNGLAFAIIMVCAYYHLVERKRIIFCYLGYVFACFFHSGGIIIVLLVAVTVITLNTSGKFINFVLLFGFTAGTLLMRWLSTVTDNGFVQSIASKTEHFSQSGVSTETGMLVNISVVVVLSLLVWYYSSYFTESDFAPDLRRLYKFSATLCFFLIGGMTVSGMAFLRTARWIVPVVGALVYAIGSQIQAKEIEEKGINYLNYYAPTSESLRIKIKPIVNAVYVLYTLVHFWYACNGSSLIWMHFEWEWKYL